MYDDQAYQHENTPDPLDDFLAQLLSDIPDLLPGPIPIPTPTSASVFIPAIAPAVPASASAPVVTSASPFPSSFSFATAVTTATIDDATSPHLTCQWVSPHNPLHSCGSLLSHDPKHACMHLRQAHNVRGNEKVMVRCHWRDCLVAPMQRGSLVRHVLTVHLSLLRWRCEACGRSFSRRGTPHTCVP